MSDNILKRSLDVTCEDFLRGIYAEKSSPAQTAIYAKRAAQAYCDRWQIETSFFVMKQEFALEKARVRTFRRLENIFTLCVMAYVYATRFLRKAKGFNWTERKYFSPNVFRGLVKNRDKLSRRNRDKGGEDRVVVVVEYF